MVTPKKMSFPWSANEAELAHYPTPRMQFRIRRTAASPGRSTNTGARPVWAFRSEVLASPAAKPHYHSNGINPQEAECPK